MIWYRVNSKWDKKIKETICKILVSAKTFCFSAAMQK